jgi:predicted hotdog family 3-hydroxylacyl-ACP dehydratase
MLPISGDKLIELIPQKLPFVLISALHEVSATTSATTFTFDETHVLCSNGELTSAGLMENIAQTAAAKTGYECLMKGIKIPIGFIGDVRDFYFTRLPKVGEEIHTEITIIHEIFDVTIISGVIKLKGEEIASCRMKIFIEPEEKPAEQTK